MPTTDLARAAELGRSWAEQKADTLDGTPPADWPESWEPAWNGKLVGALAGSAKQSALVDIATHAAHERWVEIVEERRDQDDPRSDRQQQGRPI